MTVTGSSGLDAHTTQTITVQVVDFQISATTPINTTPNVAGNSAVTITAINGFSGVVNLTSSDTTHCTLSPASVTGSGTATLSCNFPSGGTFIITVTGTSSNLVHTAQVTFNVQDFTITNNGPISVVQGQCNTATITVTSQGGFFGTVQLTANAPAGLNATLNPISVTMSGSSTLKVCAPTAATGTYTVVVTGTSTSPSLTHNTNVSVTVTPPGGTTCPDNTNPTHTCNNPGFSQMNWSHRLSLRKTGGVQTWKFGIFNPNNDTLFVQVVISGSDGSGVSGFTVSTVVLTVNPTNSQNPPLNNQVLSFAFPATDQGDTFTFTATIFWGTSPTSLTNTSNSANPGIPTSGSFTIVA